MKPIFLFVIFFNIAASAEPIFEDGFESCVTEVVFQENFTLPNQTGWGGLWQESGVSSEVIEVLNNQGRLVALSSNNPYSLGRMKHPLGEANAEALFSFVFENAGSQGIGFYLRSNGGHLDKTNPTGQGYGVFIERFSSDESRLGLWYEHDGIETAFIRQPQISPSVFYDFQTEVKYWVRYQVFQETPTTTMLRAKIWQDSQLEPLVWGVSQIDNYPPLQNLADGIVVDSFHTQSTGTITQGVRIDDITVARICN